MSEKVNRSAMVRMYVEKRPEASVDQIVEALKKHGVNKSTVYQVRNSMKSNGSDKVEATDTCSETITATPINQTVDTSDTTITDLRAVAKLRDSLGGMRNLKKAMATLETLVSN